MGEGACIGADDAFNFSTTLRHTTPQAEVVQIDTMSAAVLLSALLGWPLVASRCVPLLCSARGCTPITSVCLCVNECVKVSE